jgi:pilus assembly protein Flp/PilA
MTLWAKSGPLKLCFEQRDLPQLNQFFDVCRQLSCAIASSVSQKATLLKVGKGSRLTTTSPVKSGPRKQASLMAGFARFLKDENAATAIEYGLIAAGIAVAIIPVTIGLGIKLKTTFSAVQSALR